MLTTSLIYATLTIKVPYMLTITLTIYAYYNFSRRYDKTLLMTLFDAFLSAVGV